MKTIDEIKKGPAHKSPYPKALRAQIVKIVQKERAHEISLADHTGAIKCVGYDNICHDFHEGQVIMLRQFQRGISGILLANKKTHVRLCPALKVPISDQIMKRAQMLVDPPEPPVISISSIQVDPEDTIVSVEGIITQVSINKNFQLIIVLKLCLHDTTMLKL